jgi:hypothetical protein
MSKRQGKGVRQTVKVLLSGARKMVYPCEDETFFVGSSSSRSRRSQLLSHVEAEGSSQQRRPVSEILHNILNRFCYTNYISYDLYNFAGWLKVD